MSSPSTQKHLKVFLTLLYIALGVVAAYLIFKYAISWFLPFIIAFIISRLIEPLVKLLVNKCKIPRKLSSFIAVITSYIAIGTILYFLIAWLAGELSSFVKELPSYINTVSTSLYALRDRLYDIIGALPGDVPQVLINLIDNFLANFSIPTSTITSLTLKVTNIAFSLPTAIIFVIVMLVSTYFISSDYHNIKKIVLLQIPEKVKNGIHRTFTHLLETLGKWIKAMGIIIIVTFSELAIGFAIIGVDYAILVALIVAIIDILPILGVGTVLIPWSLISLVTGDYYTALCMIILYIVITVVRNIVEPKIVGYHIGLHPLVTLICMYVGLKTIGFLGMFLFPIIAITLQKLQEWGYIKLWKTETADIEQNNNDQKDSSIKTE